MIGGGVLGECLADSGVRQVASIARSEGTVRHEKLREFVHPDFLDFSNLESSAFAGIDAAFFCLGVSSRGMSEESYTRATYGFTLAAAQTLARASPNATFIYVSALLADTAETGSAMWARVRGRTENALLALPLKSYIYRPGLIQPLDGAVSRTPSFRLFYRLASPVMPLLRRMFPESVTDTKQIGRAMLRIARDGYPGRLLYSKDLNSLDD